MYKLPCIWVRLCGLPRFRPGFAETRWKAREQGGKERKKTNTLYEYLFFRANGLTAGTTNTWTETYLFN